MDWFENLSPYLPHNLRKSGRSWEEEYGAGLTELRFRTGSVPLGFADGKLLTLDDRVLTAQDIERMASAFMEYTPAVHRQQRQEGYITLEGGIRVGLCGVTRREEGQASVQKVTSLCIRICRDLPQCSLSWLRRLYGDDDLPKSCLLVSPPGMGKTTLLRDAAFQMGKGFDKKAALKVVAADERGELCTPSVQSAADVLIGVHKSEAITWLLRSMSPQVLIVDEVASFQEAALLSEAVLCGIRVIASAHARNLREVKERESLKELTRSVSCIAVLGETPGRIVQWEQIS